MSANADKINEVAARLGVPSEWLDSIIAFESGYDPQAVNPIPYNKRLVDKGLDTPRHARGLIQFIDSTAQDLGFADSADLVKMLPDFDRQMDGAVYPYFNREGPFVSQQDFYMTVFYPAYRKTDPAKAFPDSVLAVNPGITTPQSYIDRVNASVPGKKIIAAVKTGGGNLVVLALVGVGAWLFLKG
jgi:hypothetical protein